MTRVLGVALLVAGIWVAVAAPEPERLGWAAVGADDAEEDTTGLDALSPADWAASAAAPTEWTGLWGLVAYTVWDDSARARRRLAAVVRGLARERHHDRAWAAIWTSLVDGDLAVPGVAEPEDARVELRLLAEAIRTALGEREYLAELALYERVDPDRLSELLAAGDLPRPSPHGGASDDATTLAARIEAHWSAVARIAEPGWRARLRRGIAVARVDARAQIDAK